MLKENQENESEYPTDRVYLLYLKQTDISTVYAQCKYWKTVRWKLLKR